MGQKRDRVNGALKKAFAEKHGKSLRWAQIEAAKDSPAWRAFLAAQFPPSSAEAAGGGGEGAPMGGASDLARAGEAKESAWQILKRMEEQLETAARSGDVGLIASFTRAVREARANWERPACMSRGFRRRPEVWCRFTCFTRCGRGALRRWRS